MQGCKQFEPRLFYQISLEDLVPKDHLLPLFLDIYPPKVDLSASGGLKVLSPALS